MRPKQQPIDLLRKVRRIEIKARGLSEQVFAGQYHSAFRGRGMAFSEVRNYQVGDDVRDLDWNVTARYAHPFVKVFEEERELTVMLLVDMSGSSDFGTRGQTKRELNAEIAATLACSASQNNDKVGAILFTDRVERFIPPRSGRKHILYLLRELLSFEPQSRHTDLSVPLTYLSKVIKRRSTAFLISDFYQWDVDYSLPLSLSARRHDLIAIRTFDEGARTLPSLGLAHFLDAETGEERWVDTSSRRVARAWAEQVTEQEARFHNSCLRAGVDHIAVATNEDYVPALSKLFGRRP